MFFKCEPFLASSPLLTEWLFAKSAQDSVSSSHPLEFLAKWFTAEHHAETELLITARCGAIATGIRRAPARQEQDDLQSLCALELT
jgi:hypothetical protein